MNCDLCDVRTHWMRSGLCTQCTMAARRGGNYVKVISGGVIGGVVAGPIGALAGGILGTLLGEE